MITSEHRARPGSVYPFGAGDIRISAHTPSLRRGKMALVAAILPVLALGVGCGSSDAAAVEAKLAVYLDSQGLGSELEVMDGGCSDARFEQEGFALWKCVVYQGNDAQTWNVLFDGAEVVDASED